MSDQEQPDKEPSSDEPGRASVATKERRAFARVVREMSDSDLGNPAVGRMLLDDVDRLERENALLSEFRDKYWGVKETLAALSERGKRSRASEIVFGGRLGLGGVVIGYAATAWSHQPDGWFSLIFGFVLMMIAIVSRMVMR